MNSLRPLSAWLWVMPPLLASVPGRPQSTQTIVLASTTSVQDSGLADAHPAQFTNETGIEVHVLAQGTGQALATAAHGDADLVLVHDPEAEAAFMAAGHGSSRAEIAWNDFIIVGPDADPAHVAGRTDATDAFKAIAASSASVRLARRQERHRCRGKAAVASGRANPPEAWYRESAAAWGLPSTPRARWRPTPTPFRV